jgi:hypothetical protein
MMGGCQLSGNVSNLNIDKEENLEIGTWPCESTRTKLG